MPTPIMTRPAPSTHRLAMLPIEKSRGYTSPEHLRKLDLGPPDQKTRSSSCEICIGPRVSFYRTGIGVPQRENKPKCKEVESCPDSSQDWLGIREPGVSTTSHFKAYYYIIWGFSGGSVVKNLPANAGDMGSTSGSRRSPGEKNGNPLQYSSGKSHWQRSLVGYSPCDGIAKKLAQLSD